MGVKNIRWHMVSCVDDRGGGWVGVVDLKRKKGRKVTSLSVLSLVNPRHVSTLQSSSGGIGSRCLNCCSEWQFLTFLSSIRNVEINCDFCVPYTNHFLVPFLQLHFLYCKIRHKKWESSSISLIKTYITQSASMALYSVSVLYLLLIDQASGLY